VDTTKPGTNQPDRRQPVAAAAEPAGAAEPAAAAQTTPATAPLLIDRRTAPLGVVPRHLQLWTLIGIAVVMVGIMSISGDRTPPRSASASAPAVSGPAGASGSVIPAVPAITDANQQRIEEYEQRIQDQAQRLAGEQVQLHLAKQAFGEHADPSDPSARPANTTTGVNNPNAVNNANVSDNLREERLQRAYRSLFADNVAFSRGQQLSQQGPQESLQPAPQPPSAPSRDVVPSIAASATATTQITAPTTQAERTYRISEGAIIETVLTNRLDGTFAGPVNCLVTTPVYAEDRQHLLIPAGARALGDAVAVNAFGQSRLAVAFHRLLLANGRRIDLQSFHGLNQIGETGLQDLVNQHYAQIFGASLAIGAIAGLAQMHSTAGLDVTAFDAYRQGGAASLAQSSAHILDRFLNVLPTVTIREGHRIKIYLANDLDVPEYRDGVIPAGGHQ
jgi:type IV secretion system protein VirB10